MSSDLAGRVALVTGGVRGIGAEIANALAAVGVAVIVHGRDTQPSAPTKHRYVSADLSKPDGADRLVAALRDVEILDILVNNAGYEIEEDSTRLSIEEWQHTMNVNLYAPVRLVGLLADRLAASSAPSVVNITSIHERYAYPRHLSYSVSKAGLAMATRVLALELAPRGIRVNAVAPGAIETDINRETIERVGRGSFEHAIPAGRIGSASDVSGAVIYLAGPSSSYVTGTTLYVDGAYSESIVRY